MKYWKSIVLSLHRSECVSILHLPIDISLHAKCEALFVFECSNNDSGYWVKVKRLVKKVDHPTVKCYVKFDKTRFY